MAFLRSLALEVLRLRLLRQSFHEFAAQSKEARTCSNARSPQARNGRKKPRRGQQHEQYLLLRLLCIRLRAGPGPVHLFINILYGRGSVPAPTSPREDFGGLKGVNLTPHAQFRGGHISA